MVPEKLALPVPCLCLVTDRRLVPDGSLAGRVARAVAGGVGMVQLREKDLPGDELLPLARELRTAVGNGALFVVNGDAEVAHAVGADGVHLGEQSMRVREARGLLGNRRLVGRSVRSVAGAIQAQDDGADYLIVGTVFESLSKPGETLEGLALLRGVAREVKIPFMGIGGVNATNVVEVMETGARGAAVISALLAAPDPGASAREMARVMASAAASLTPGPFPVRKG